MHEWKMLVASAYDETWWTRLNGSEAHYQIVKAIAQPLRVKLLYDSYLWRWVIEKYIRGAAQIVELLPGWSHTIAVALESLRFGGTLVQVDLERPQASITPFSFKRNWVQRNIFDAADSLSNAQLIVGNHILDDILICQAHALDEERRRYYSSSALSRRSWGNLVTHPSLPMWLNATVSCISNLVSGLSPGQILVLREYPSTIATQQEDQVRWNTERQIQERAYRHLIGLTGVNVARPDLSYAPVPPGCRFPRSFLIVTKI